MEPEVIKPATTTPAPDKPGTSISVETVAKLETVTLKIASLRAALLCTVNEETCPYLNGVYLHRTANGFVRAVSTDGHRLLMANLYREAADQPGPAWLSLGVIICADQLAARLSLIEKTQGAEKGQAVVTIAFAKGAKHLEISDHSRASVFRDQPVDGTFPDYERLVGSFGGTFDDGDVGEFKPTAFNPSFLKTVGEVAAKLGSEAVSAYAMPDRVIETPAKDGKPAKVERLKSPTMFTFGGIGVAMIVMPHNGVAPMNEADRAILAPAIKSSLAALKAHETRNRVAAGKLTGPAKVAALAKADEFKAKMAALVERAGTGTVAKALDAPKPPPPPPPPLNVADALGKGPVEKPTLSQLVDAKAKNGSSAQAAKAPKAKKAKG
ncbi:MAG TPA: hypothetical protein VK630_13260 [Reyranella sp.]|nr:hypothetical protein [Reyranella sp.]